MAEGQWKNTESIAYGVAIHTFQPALPPAGTLAEGPQELREDQNPYQVSSELDSK
jgi:hypothetical protein